jgi:hypothetical protein
MIRSVYNLFDYTVEAEDGLVGDVLDFYIDDSDWQVRYLIVEPENDLTSLPAVLLSNVALGKPDDDEQNIPVKLSRQVVKDSPEIRLDETITRQQEIELHNYYGWPFYWGPTTVSGFGPGNLLAAYPLIESKEEAEENPDAELKNNPHLHSTQRIIGFRIHARDGEIGHIKDLLIEDDKWNVLYTVADTGNLLPGRQVLLSLSWIDNVDWEAGKVDIDLSRGTIEKSPEYDPDVPLDREYETRLYGHYGRNGYW